MSKSKGASEVRRLARIDKAFLWIRQGVRDSKIIESLMNEEHISRRTAERAIQAAWDTIAGLGRGATEHERGLLLSRMNQLYAEVSLGEGKNIDQAIKILALGLKMIPHKQQGEVPHGHAFISNTPLAPEFEEALRRLEAS